jgi:hypothetical protein
MKKILVLVTVLALVAALIVPMAVLADSANEQAQGNMVAPTITFTGPVGVIDFSTFAPGRNPAGTAWQNGPTCDVVLTQNSDSNASYTLTAGALQDTSTYNFTAGKMWNSTLGYMTDPMYITLDNGAHYAQLPGTVSVNGTAAGVNNYYTLGAAQVIESADGAKGPGQYFIWVQLTAQVNY